MAAKALTAKAIDNFRAGATRREIPDGGCRGLFHIIQPSGRRSWAVRYRFQGATRKLTLEGITGLAQARKAATAALHELELGPDPAALKFDARAAADREAVQRASAPVDYWATECLERCAKPQTRARTYEMTEYILTRIVLPAWRGRSIHDIRRKDVIDLVDRVARDRPVLANRVLACCSKMFNWLASKDQIVASPCAGV